MILRLHVTYTAGVISDRLQRLALFMGLEHEDLEVCAYFPWQGALSVACGMTLCCDATAPFFVHPADSRAAFPSWLPDLRITLHTGQLMFGFLFLWPLFHPKLASLLWIMEKEYPRGASSLQV